MADNILVPLNELEKEFPELSIQGTLKNGGQKNVFHANHATYGAVVLKVFSPEMERDRVYREINIEQRNIPYVPKVFETAEKQFSTGTYFTAIEQKIDGEDLNTLFCKNGRINYDFAVNILRGVLGVLMVTEVKGIVHRDIKPDNIICDNDGNFWLIDFGAARDLADKTLTMTGWSAPLTCGYAAPEQYDSSMRDMIDVRTDLFSLGVTVYTLLAGKNPFIYPRMNAYEVAATTRQHHAKTLQIPNDDNGGLAKFLKLMMKKDISARPPSAKRALEWLALYIGSEA